MPILLENSAAVVNFAEPEKLDVVIGVCVGSIRTEIIKDEFVEVRHDSTEYKELKLKIEQFGVAHDIRPLLGWRPKLLDGASLQEASAVK